MESDRARVERLSARILYSNQIRIKTSGRIVALNTDDSARILYSNQIRIKTSSNSLQKFSIGVSNTIFQSNKD